MKAEIYVSLHILEGGVDGKAQVSSFRWKKCQRDIKHFLQSIFSVKTADRSNKNTCRKIILKYTQKK
mgnify:CR=1 FL=1|jgi:hypothetical protein